MKIILDTNVLISAFVFGGNSAKSLEYSIEKCDVCISPWILEELRRTLKEKFKISTQDVIRIEQILKSDFHLFLPHTKLPAICRDKDDNHILQLAESTHADYIITGDKDLLVIHKYKKTEILDPKRFLERVI